MNKTLLIWLNNDFKVIPIANDAKRMIEEYTKNSSGLLSVDIKVKLFQANDNADICIMHMPVALGCVFFSKELKYLRNFFC